MRRVIAISLMFGCSNTVEGEGAPALELDQGSGDKTPIQYFDDGEACFYADGYPEDVAATTEPQPFDEHSRLAATVAAPECLSQTCDLDRVAFCDVEMDSNTITVTSYLAYNEVDADMCTLDCGKLAARCKSEPLAAGDYLVVHGETQLELRVPSVVTPCSP